MKTKKQTNLIKIISGAMFIALGILIALFLCLWDIGAADALAVFADASYDFVNALLAWALRIIAGVMYVPATLHIVQGIIDAQEARAEGSGPAADKAKQKIITGISMVLIATAVITSANSIVNALSDAL